MLRISLLSLCVSVALAVVRCKHETPAHSPAKAAEPATAVTDPNLVSLTIEQVERTGLALGTIGQAVSSGALQLQGEIAAHRDATAQVNAIADGVVQQLNVKLFGTVTKGQVVATLTKPELVDWQQALLEGRDRIAFLQSEYDRYAVLKEADATALKNFNKAAADLRAAQTTQRMNEARLRQYQIDPAQIEAGQLVQTISILAPATGTVTELLTNQGAALHMGAPICTITSTDKLHLDLFVYEQDLPLVQKGRLIQWSLPSQPDKQFAAQIMAIDPALDMEKRAVRIHANLQGAKPAPLAVGQFVNAKVQPTGAGTRLGPALPDAAVVREGDGEFVFTLKTKEPEHWVFEKHKVMSAGSKDGMTAVRFEKPLPEGAQVVVKGAYYISAQGAGVEVEE